MIPQEQPNAVAFERPDKLSLVAFQATLKSDGKELKAKIEDAASKNVDGQVVVRPVPKPLKLNDLARDELLYETISSRLRRQPVQLELLLEAGGLIAGSMGMSLASGWETRSMAAGSAFALRFRRPVDRLCFGSIKKIFYCGDSIIRQRRWVPDLANDASVTQLELFADLRGAAVIGERMEPSQFAPEVPPNAKSMKAFTRPPLPLPTDRLGSSLCSFR